ncbi:DUF1667 domain-containing protein [Salipaludibacillus aurantiacus]|uniref:CxxC motif-containing protein n=1 Tax=Salipaludibacillus aurantiacus TaxID=1601833 RepID=A0A1H9VXY2_9BACI|nr:DUF1667 domain-containing protein [Salipaludibacillus aurantiacus]SES26371.1 CxxC motif-containing protein [Salipaludibacillus aurantiacus]
MNMTELTCITCPIGCHLEVIEVSEDGAVSFIVRGNTCKRGEKYGIEEMTNPTRMVTTTVKVEGAHLPRVPVKTSEPVPKDSIFECMKVLNTVQLQAPVLCGEKVVEDFQGLGIDIIATRSLDKV